MKKHELNADARKENAEFAFIDEARENPYQNVFIASLETLTQDDLAAPAKRKKEDPIDAVIALLRRIIFIAAVIAFCVSGVYIVYKNIAYKQSEDLYADIQNIADVKYAMPARPSPLLMPVNGDRSQNQAVQEDTYNEMFEKMKGHLASLQKKSEEVVGWLRVEGETEIDYPIVQHTDNDYYLTHAYNGTYNPAGAIYLDYKNLTRFSDNRHTIIYGHNMRSGSPMFANLLKYKSQEFFENNRYIKVYMRDALYTYEIFAAYSANPVLAADKNHAWRMNFNHDNDLFLEWIDAVRARSNIKNDVKIDGSSRILTLSTCTNYDYNRYVVHAVLIKVEK